MSDKDLKLVRSRPEILSEADQLVQLFYRTGILQYLRTIGRVERRPNPTTETSALDGMYSAGWQDCLDAIFNFKERYLLGASPNYTSLPDYGAIERSLAQGVITKEEANAIRFRRPKSDPQGPGAA